MNPNEKLRLTANRTYLLDNIDVEHVSNSLLGDGIFNEDELEELNVIANPRDRCAKLLNWLPRKGPTAYEVFRRSLEKSPTQKHIVPVLDSTDFSQMPRNAGADAADARKVGGPGRQAGQQWQPEFRAQGHYVQVKGDNNIVISGSNVHNVTINR
ncbi:uncharacterized protein LOC117123564 isoform X2 [Anneissia japonica]|nr:uncharacterized protein LOC117123564 isoform X2 [Anneissia japonica]